MDNSARIQQQQQHHPHHQHQQQSSLSPSITCLVHDNQISRICLSDKCYGQYLLCEACVLDKKCEQNKHYSDDHELIKLDTYVHQMLQFTELYEKNWNQIIELKDMNLDTKKRMIKGMYSSCYNLVNKKLNLIKTQLYSIITKHFKALLQKMQKIFQKNLNVYIQIMENVHAFKSHEGEISSLYKVTNKLKLLKGYKWINDVDLINSILKKNDRDWGLLAAQIGNKVNACLSLIDHTVLNIPKISDAIEYEGNTPTNSSNSNSSNNSNNADPEESKIDEIMNKPLQQQQQQDRMLIEPQNTTNNTNNATNTTNTTNTTNATNTTNTNKNNDQSLQKILTKTTNDQAIQTIPINEEIPGNNNNNNQKLDSKGLNNPNNLEKNLHNKPKTSNSYPKEYPSNPHYIKFKIQKSSKSSENSIKLDKFSTGIKFKSYHIDTNALSGKILKKEKSGKSRPYISISLYTTSSKNYILLGTERYLDIVETENFNKESFINMKKKFIKFNTKPLISMICWKHSSSTNNTNTNDTNTNANNDNSNTSIILCTHHLGGIIKFWKLGESTIEKQLCYELKTLTTLHEIKCIDTYLDEFFFASQDNGTVKVWNLNTIQGLSNIQLKIRPLNKEEVLAGDIIESMHVCQNTYQNELDRPSILFKTGKNAIIIAQLGLNPDKTPGFSIKGRIYSVEALCVPKEQAQYFYFISNSYICQCRIFDAVIVSKISIDYTLIRNNDFIGITSILLDDIIRFIFINKGRLTIADADFTQKSIQKFFSKEAFIDCEKTNKAIQLLVTPNIDTPEELVIFYWEHDFPKQRLRKR